MNIFQLLLYRDLPPDFRFTYGNFISSCKQLKNGWVVARLSNGFTFLIHKEHEHLSVPAVKKIFEAADGKFMLLTRDGERIVYSPTGQQLTPFDKYSLLYPNGWYQYMENNAYSLYNSKGICVGNHLRWAKVYANGMYCMSINKDGNAIHAGVFAADGTRLCFTNSVQIKILHNGWFVVENMLFDNTGEAYIGELPGRKIPKWMLKLVGNCMKPQKK